MNEDRLQRKILRLKEENAELKKEQDKFRELIFRYEEKEKLLDATMQEYQMLVVSLRQTKEQYDKLLKKLRAYDGKIERKYNKAVKNIIGSLE